MKAAKAVRDYKRKRAAEKRARGEKTGGGILSLFGLGRSRRSKKRPVGGRHSSGHGVVLVRGSTSRTHSGRSSHSSRRSGSRRHEKGTFLVAKFEHNTELCGNQHIQFSAGIRSMLTLFSPFSRCILTTGARHRQLSLLQMLDELMMAGEMQESSKKSILRAISQSDGVEEQENSEDGLARLVVRAVRAIAKPLVTLLDRVRVHSADRFATEGVLVIELSQVPDRSLAGLLQGAVQAVPVVKPELAE